MVGRTVIVYNLKCGGCANTIRESLGQVKGVSNVSVDAVQSTVRFDANDFAYNYARLKLDELGYPERCTEPDTHSDVAISKSCANSVQHRIAPKASHALQL
jgi:copper chaperone